VGGWYWIGVAAGFGSGAGVLLAGALGAGRRALVVAAVAGLAAGAAIGYGIDAGEPGGWGDILAGALGGLAGGFGASQIVAGALRRGGTRTGTAALVAAAGLLAAALGLVPALGYLEALALPALAARLRRRRPERYAGLRTLARD